mgnify:CR=1 FL=1
MCIRDREQEYKNNHTKPPVNVDKHRRNSISVREWKEVLEYELIKYENKSDDNLIDDTHKITIFNTMNTEKSRDNSV